MDYKTKADLTRVIDDFFTDNLHEQQDENFNKTKDSSYGGLGSYRSNLLETNKSYMLEMQAPGLTKNDITVIVENGVLVVTSVAEEHHDLYDSKAEKITYLRREFYNTELELDYRLPDNVDIDNIKAKVENGVLGIVIPKLVKNSNNKKQIKIS